MIHKGDGIMERQSATKPSYLTEDKIEEMTQFFDGLLEFMSDKKGPFIMAMNHAKKSLKNKSDQKPIVDYLIAESKLWDKLILAYDKKR
jgi:hypothetical protein